MYDVIVVGAGPAGSTCAAECAKSGLKTLLIDKDAFPRSKPCAGAVSEQALSYLDFALPPEIIERECFGAFIHMRGRSVEIRKKQRIAVLVSRDKFDAFLLKKALERGVHFLSGEKVININTDRDFMEVSTEKSSHKARYIVGADGVHSRAAQYVRPQFKKEETVLALVCSVPADNGDIDKRLGGSLDMYFGVSPLGYAWIFPHNGYYSVGVGGLASEFSRPMDALLDFSGSAGLRLADIRGHFIPLGGIRRKIFADRILLSGDAAGFADPFHGEGIVHAVLSGRLAAQAVAAVVKNETSESEAFSLYQKKCERLIRKNLRAALYMARLIDRFPTFFRRIFFDNKKALDKYLDIPQGRLTYARFWKWLILRSPFYLFKSYLF